MRYVALGLLIVGLYAALSVGLGTIGWALYGAFAPEGAPSIGFWLWVAIGFGACLLSGAIRGSVKLE